MRRKNGLIPGTRVISGFWGGINPENAPLTISKPVSWMNDRKRESLTSPFSTALTLSFISFDDPHCLVSAGKKDVRKS